MLGLVLGLTALAGVHALSFIPVTAALIVAWGWNNRPVAIRRAFLMAAVAVLTTLPWTVRNYLTFGELVPGRNGAGQIAFISVVGSAGTLAPHTLRSTIKPAWTAESPFHAVSNMQRYEERRPLYRFQMDYAKELGTTRFAAMNEAQRDAWFLGETVRFLRTHPVLSAELAVEKIKLFVRLSESPLGAILCPLAAAGGLLAFRAPGALGLALWAGAFVVPFVIITPFSIATAPRRGPEPERCRRPLVV